MQAGGAPACSCLEFDSAFSWAATRSTILGSTRFALTSTMMSDESPSGPRSSQMASAMRVAFCGDHPVASFSRSSRSHRGGKRVPIALMAVSISFVSDIGLFRIMRNSINSATLPVKDELVTLAWCLTPSQSESPCTHGAGTPVNCYGATSAKAIAFQLGALTGRMGVGFAAAGNLCNGYFHRASRRDNGGLGCHLGAAGPRQRTEFVRGPYRSHGRAGVESLTAFTTPPYLSGEDSDGPEKLGPRS